MVQAIAYRTLSKNKGKQKKTTPGVVFSCLISHMAYMAQFQVYSCKTAVLHLKVRRSLDKVCTGE